MLPETHHEHDVLAFVGRYVICEAGYVLRLERLGLGHDGLVSWELG
jgi:hypothetical protein